MFQQSLATLRRKYPLKFSPLSPSVVLSIQLFNHLCTPSHPVYILSVTYTKARPILHVDNGSNGHDPSQPLGGPGTAKHTSE